METKQRYLILLVDDSLEDRVTYRRYLQQSEDYTYEILEADSAESAMNLCQPQLPDVILLDYNLPDQDGLEFLRQWFKQFHPAWVPIIILTGEGNEMMATQALQQGAIDYQVKAHLTAEQLNEMVLQAIKKNQLKQSENRLKEQEELLKLFIQYAPAEIAMFDQKMCYLMASQRWIKAYRLRSMEAILNHSHYEIFPEIPERWRLIHQRCLTGATEQCEDELFVRADGSKQWVSWEVRPWYRATGEIGGIIIFSQDVTSRKEAEMALQGLNRYLEQRVQERTEELQAVNEQLSESLQNLKQSEQETEDLYNNAPCGYHSLNQEGLIVRINNTELSWLGLDRDEVINKKHYTDFLTAEGKRAFQENFPRLKQQGWINNLEFELPSLNGKSRWVSISATAIKDQDGNFLMSRSTIFDVSDRRLAEQALQRQVKQQNAILMISQAIRQSLDLEVILNTVVQEIKNTLLVERAAIYHFYEDWSGEFIVEAVDHQWIPLVGFTGKKVWNDTYLQETRGGRFQDHENFIVPDIYQAGLQDCHIALLEQFQAKAYAIFPIFSADHLWGLLAVYQNSQPRCWQEWEIHLLEQIANQSAIAIYQAQLYQQLEEKLQEQQHIKEALNQSKEQFELVIEASNDGFWNWNVLTNEIYYSPRWKAMFGYEDHELPNRLETWERLIFPEDSQAAWALVEDCKVGKVKNFFMTQRFTHKQGHTVYIHCRAIHVKDEQGQIIRMVGSHSDITEMMTIQQALKSSQLDLQSTSEQLRIKFNELEKRQSELQTLAEMSEFLQACSSIPEACQAVSVFIANLFPNCSGAGE